MEMLVRLEQPWKVSFSIFVIFSDITIETNCLMGSFFTINIGPSALVRLEQPQKALSPISVTDSGMVILVRLEQPEKAYSPISVTDGGMMEFLHPLISILLSVWIMVLLSSRES